MAFITCRAWSITKESFVNKCNKNWLVEKKNTLKPLDNTKSKIIQETMLCFTRSNFLAPRFCATKVAIETEKAFETIQ